MYLPDENELKPSSSQCYPSPPPPSHPVTNTLLTSFFLSHGVTPALLLLLTLVLPQPSSPILSLYLYYSSMFILLTHGLTPALLHLLTLVFPHASSSFSPCRYHSPPPSFHPGVTPALPQPSASSSSLRRYPSPPPPSHPVITPALLLLLTLVLPQLSSSSF